MTRRREENEFNDYYEAVKSAGHNGVYLRKDIDLDNRYDSNNQRSQIRLIRKENPYRNTMRLTKKNVVHRSLLYKTFV
jgi:hypothetical protein